MKSAPFSDSVFTIWSFFSTFIMPAVVAEVSATLSTVPRSLPNSEASTEEGATETAAPRFTFLPSAADT